MSLPAAGRQGCGVVYHVLTKYFLDLFKKRIFFSNNPIILSFTLFFNVLNIRK